MALVPIEADADLPPLSSYKPQEGILDGVGKAFRRKVGQTQVAIGRVGQDLGIESGLADAGRKRIAENETNVQELGDIPGNLRETATNIAGETVGDVVNTTIGGGIGAGIGGAIGSRFGMGRKGAELGAKAGAFLTSGVQSYGGIREEQELQGNDDIGAAVLGAGASALLETKYGPEGWVGDVIGGGAKRTGGRVANAGKRALQGAAIEAPTELLQSGIEQAAAGQDPFTKEGLEQGAFEAVMGAGGGAMVGGAFGALEPKAQPRAPTDAADMMRQMATGEIPDVRLEDLVPGSAQNEGMDPLGPIERSVVNAPILPPPPAPEQVDGAVPTEGAIPAAAPPAAPAADPGERTEPGTITGAPTLDPGPPANPAAVEQQLGFVPNPARGILNRAVDTGVKTGLFGDGTIVPPDGSQPNPAAQIQPAIAPAQPAAQPVTPVVDQPRSRLVYDKAIRAPEEAEMQRAAESPSTPKSRVAEKPVFEERLSAIGRPFKTQRAAEAFARNPTNAGFQAAKKGGEWIIQREIPQPGALPPSADRFNNVETTNAPAETPTLQPARLSNGADETAPAVPASPLPAQPAVPGAPTPAAGGERSDWVAFPPESGTLNVPRAEMPQVKSEHRGAMVNYLNARGISHAQEDVPASSLKPTQTEFSNSKVDKALAHTGGDRSILVSSDGHILDGHHQWLAKREAGKPVSVIRLNAPIKDLLTHVKEFPSSKFAPGASPVRQSVKPGGWSERPAREGSKSIVGIHYTKKAGLTELLGTEYGSNHAGAESKRLAELDGERAKTLRNRVYFYPDGSPLSAKGESMVGRAGKHRVQLDNIYDIAADPLKLKAIADQPGTSDNEFFNELEWQVVQHGFDGYTNPNSQMIVVLGSKSIPVGKAEPADVAQKPAPKKASRQSEMRASNSAEKPTSGSRADVLRRIYEPITSKWGIKVTVTNTPNEFPDSAKRSPGFSPDRSEAVIVGDTIYIAASQVDTLRDAYRLLAHEGVAHAGLERSFGDKWPAMSKQIAKLVESTPWINEAIQLRYPGADEDTVAAEGLAIIAETGHESTVLSSAVAKIRALLRGLGFKVEFSERDIREMLAAAARRMHENKAATSRFSSKADTIDVDGVKRPVADSTGRPIHYTEDGLRNFWRWFGDSKVVDDAGRPVPQFHATQKDFDAFKVSSVDIGAHFGTAAQALDRRDVFGAQTIPVYLRINNPLRVPDMGRWKAERLRKMLHSADLIEWVDGKWATPDGKPVAVETIPQIRKLIESMGYDGLVYLNEWEAPRKRRPEDEASIERAERELEDAREEYRSAGGFWYSFPDKDNGIAGWARLRDANEAVAIARANAIDNAVDTRADSFAVFHPEQIKSSISNSGAFNPRDKRIQFSSAPDTQGIEVDEIDTVQYAGLSETERESDALARSAAALYKALGTDSPVFRRWFGDSKMRKENGQPLKLYHATNADFEAFDLARRGESTGFSASGLGIFMNPKRARVERYGDRTLELYASIKKPYRMPVDESSSFETVEDAARFREGLIRQGYDGIVVKDDLTVIAFFQHQVKATDNAGTFSGDRLRFSNYGAANRPLEGAPPVAGHIGPIEHLVDAAITYAKAAGIDLRRQAEYVNIDPDRAKRIADAYEAMPHAPQDPVVREAYADLIKQTTAQYRALEAAGYKFSLFDGDSDPYGGHPHAAMRDLRENRSMAVYSTAAGFGSSEIDVSDNPLLADTGIKWPFAKTGEMRPVLANDLFRAVHDAFGHGMEGAGFRARGEENAWQAHVRLFTGKAIAAITTETRGQNSWLNYGPHGEKNKSAKVEDTVFADQKTGLLPEWAWTEGRAADGPRFSSSPKLRKDVDKIVGRVAKHLTERELGFLRRDTAQNLVDTIKQMPSAKEMASVALAGKAKRGWYADSAAAILRVFGHDGPRFAALLAATSPQTSVENNLLNALSVWKNWVAAGRPQGRKEIVSIMGRSVQGNKGEKSVLGAWIPNAVASLTQDPESIVLSGPKVNSFMLNLRGYVDEVTNDAWMANYALVDQETFSGRLTKSGNPGKGAGYLAMSARAREAAERLTKLTGEKWTPAEVQETVWSWAKTAYELAQSKGESRSVVQLVRDNAITDELIGATPAFGDLFHEAQYATILRAAGYDIDGAGGKGNGPVGSKGAGTKGQAASTAGHPDQADLERAARRLDKLSKQRAEEKAAKKVVEDKALAEKQSAEKAAEDREWEDFLATPGDRWSMSDARFSNKPDSLMAARMRKAGAGDVDSFWKRWHNLMLGTAAPPSTLSMIGNTDSRADRTRKAIEVWKADAEKESIESILEQYGKREGGGVGDDGLIAAKYPKQILTAAGIRPTFENAVAAYAAIGGKTRGKESRMSNKARNPIFYSALLRAVEGGTMPKKAGAKAYQQWLDGAQRRGEFKASEREWLGVDQWLEGRGETTRHEIEQFIGENTVELEEVQLGGPGAADPAYADFSNDDVWTREDADGTYTAYIGDQWVSNGHYTENQASEAGLFALQQSQASSPAKFSTYQLPGGANYRELLLTLPVSSGKNGLPAGYTLRDEGDGRWSFKGPSVSSRVYRSREEAVTAALADARSEVQNGVGIGDYRSGHWDQPNVLAHIRLNERTDADGKRVLFVEEVQSDWHQAGRRSGYTPSKRAVDAAKKRQRELSKIMDERDLTDAESAEVTELARITKFNQSRVPDAPLKKEWPLTAMKRVIRYAAENGFDRVAWTTGDQQNDRYDLSKQVDKVVWSPSHDFEGEGDVTAFRGDQVVMSEINIKAEKLPDIIGKDAADKLLNNPSRMDGRWHVIENADLKLGGSGMRGFYDKMLPAELAKYVKQWGAKVGKTTLSHDPNPDLNAALDAWEAEDGEGDGSKANATIQRSTNPSIDITPAMRKAALEGQPLFSNKPTINERLQDYMQTSKTFNWWHKSVGTQYHKAQVDDDFRPVFEQGQAFLADISRIAMETAEKAPDLLPRLEGVRDILRRGPNKQDRERVSNAIFTGTLSDQRVYMDAELRARFKFNNKQVKLYREARAAIDASLDELNASEISRLIRADVPRPVIEQIRRAPRNAAQIATAALQSKASTASVQELIDGINDRDAKILKLKDEGYAPLMRFGKYTVYVTEQSGDQIYFGTFEREADANAMARDMKDLYPKAKHQQGVMAQDSYQMFKGLSLDTLELFAEKSGMSAGRAAQDFLRLAKNNRSALKRLIHRKGVAGFDNDVARVLASFVTSNARAASTNYNMGDMTRAVSRIPKEKGDVADEATRLMMYLQNPQEEAAGLRNLLFIQFLGGSIASAALNMTQPATMTFPWLSQFAGAGRAASALAAASKIAVTGKTTDPRLAAAIKRATEEGIVAPHEIHQLYAESIRNFGSHPAIRKALTVWGSLFSLGEAFNRRMSFAAAYQLATATPSIVSKGGFQDAYDFAVNAVEATQGIYNKGNRPNWARGAIGATLFTFKQYSISYLELLKRLPKKEKAIALAVLVLASGLQGLPGSDDLEDLVDTLAQSMGYNFNSQREMREFVASVLGEEWGDYVTHGFSAGTPFDVQGRMGLGNLIPGTAILQKSAKDKTREVTEVLGPVGGLIQQMMDAYDNAQEGNIGGAALALAPLAVKNAAKGAEMAATGTYKDRLGRNVTEASDGEAALKAIGFQPQRVARVQRNVGELQQQVDMARTMESEIADQWAKAIAAGDNRAKAEAAAKLRDWNVKNPLWPIRINSGQLKRRVQMLRMSKEDRFLKSAPKELRGQLTD